MTDRPVIAKSADEVQRAHDLLRGIVIGEVSVPLHRVDVIALHAAEDVLCWLLGHDHNNAFQNNLNLLEQELAKQGIVIVKGPYVEGEG